MSTSGKKLPTFGFSQQLQKRAKIQMFSTPCAEGDISRALFFKILTILLSSCLTRIPIGKVKIDGADGIFQPIFNFFSQNFGRKSIVDGIV